MYIDQNCKIINFKTGISSSRSIQTLHSIAYTNTLNENMTHYSLPHLIVQKKKKTVNDTVKCLSTFKFS